MHIIEQMPTQKIRIVRDSSKESGKGFYARVGHLFVDKNIRKEMGGPLNSSDAWIWFLAMDVNDTIVAFACLNCEQIEKGIIWFDNAYVFPDYRQLGLHAKLTDIRMQEAARLGAKILKGLARPTAYISFEARGFAVVRQNGMYRTYQKVLNE